MRIMSYALLGEIKFHFRENFTLDCFQWDTKQRKRAFWIRISKSSSFFIIFHILCETKNRCRKHIVRWWRICTHQFLIKHCNVTHNAKNKNKKRMMCDPTHGIYDTNMNCLRYCRCDLMSSKSNQSHFFPSIWSERDFVMRSHISKWFW